VKASAKAGALFCGEIWTAGGWCTFPRTPARPDSEFLNVLREFRGRLESLVETGK